MLNQQHATGADPGAREQEQHPPRHDPARTPATVRVENDGFECSEHAMSVRCVFATGYNRSTLPLQHDVAGAGLSSRRHCVVVSARLMSSTMPSSWLEGF